MTNQQDTALLPVEPGHYQIGDRVQIIHPDWQGEPPQYIAGIDWHGKHGVTYTTAETWPPKWDGLRAEGLTDEWQECDLIRLHAQPGSAAEQAKPSASCEAGEVERVIVRAARCGHHFDQDCFSCRHAEQWTNQQLDELRAALSERRSGR